ncbi:DUF2560 family protein [Klebsiella pneumoniae]|nr:DUF2560 family protein [Klebsiella pneumoniae]
MSEITASEQIRLDIIKKVNYDTAAAKLAIDWVGDSNLKAELFQNGLVFPPHSSHWHLPVAFSLEAVCA